MEKNMYVVLWRDSVDNTDSRTFIEADTAKEAEKSWRKSHSADRCTAIYRCELERVVW